MPGIAAESWFHLDPVSLEAEIRFDGSRQSNNGVTEDKGLLAEEFLRIRKTGYGWDPAISNFNLELIPVFRQEKRTLFDESETGSGNDLNYRIDLGFLQGAKGLFDANLRSWRTTNVNDAAFALRNETDIQRQPTDGELEERVFPPTVPLHQRFLRADFRRSFRGHTGAA